MLMMLLDGLVAGAFAGAAYAVTGYLKAREKNLEKFDSGKFAKTICLGAILGAVNYQFGLGMAGDEIALLALAGEVAVLEQLVKAILAKISTKSRISRWRR